MLTGEQLQCGIYEANRRFTVLAKEYSELRPHLVLCSGPWQIDVPSSIVDILVKYPGLIEEGCCKRRALAILRLIERADNHPDSDAAVFMRELSLTIPDFLFVEGITMELRFDVMDDRLIRQLQGHSLIDQSLSLQDRPSLRVVVGTIRNLMAAILQPVSAALNTAEHPGLHGKIIPRASPDADSMAKTDDRKKGRAEDRSASQPPAG